MPSKCRTSGKWDRGFMRTLEVMVALVLLFSLVMTFMNQMLVQREETRVTDLAKVGEEGMAILHKYGDLERHVYSGNYTALNASLRLVLPADVGYNFFVYNSSGIVANVSNGNPANSAANVIYFLYGKDSYDPRRIDLVLWYHE